MKGNTASLHKMLSKTLGLRYVRKWFMHRAFSSVLYLFRTKNCSCSCWIMQTVCICCLYSHSHLVSRSLAWSLLLHDICHCLGKNFVLKKNIISLYVWEVWYLTRSYKFYTLQGIVKWVELSRRKRYTVFKDWRQFTEKLKTD